MDKKNYKAFVEKNREDVYKVVFSVVRSDRALNVAKDTFVNIFMTNDTNAQKNILHYAYNFAHSVFIMAKEPAETEEDEEVLEISSDDTDDIRDAVRYLPAETGEILCMSDVFGFPCEKICEATGLSENVVKTRLDKGRRGIKNVLKRKWRAK